MKKTDQLDSGLSVRQKSIIRREFREAHLIQDEAKRNHAITGVDLKFSDLYGISRDEVRDIVQKVKKEHRSTTHIPAEDGRRRHEKGRPPLRG